MAWSDAELVIKTLTGDRDAFGKLVDRHRRTIFALALQKGFQQAEADDLTQEVFVKAYKSLSGLQDPEAFGRWLYGIAHHAAADAARARKRRYDDVTLESVAEIESPAEPLDFLAGDLEGESAAVIRAIAELPEDQRLVLTLRYMENLSPKEIAERLGEPRGTIRARLHHALSYLQMAFGTKSQVR